MPRNVFSQVSGLHPGRSLFDLSYSRVFDCYAGRLIPIMCDEVVPGDYFRISNECIVRLQPLIAPMLHAVNIVVHYFFVPYRLLWSDWENFITGGKDGTDVSVLPRWTPDNPPVQYSLWDYLGFPMQYVAGTDRPLSFPAQAYRFIWNEYYRDQQQEAEIPYRDITVTDSITLKNKNFRKDYFTSALPWQQRGTAPAFPISGTAHALWNSSAIVNGAGAAGVSVATVLADNKFYVNDANGRNNLLGALAQNSIDLSTATTFTVSDLRLSVQIQKFLERNARAGVRYTEFLQEHFGVHPKDERLQRPEYIGGSKQPLIVSEVLKTSQDGANPQGNLAGHGLSASMAKVASYHAKEYGLIMGIMSIVPELVYNSQGIDRQWLRRSRYDFYFPEFAHLSEQAIENEEIFLDPVEATNRGIWGYQGRYDEMRVKRSGTAANMRASLSYWHMARHFSTRPSLNAAFMNIDGAADSYTRVFAVHTEPGYIVHFANDIKALRPLPNTSEPGLMDHF